MLKGAVRLAPGKVRVLLVRKIGPMLSALTRTNSGAPTALLETLSWLAALTESNLFTEVRKIKATTLTLITLDLVLKGAVRLVLGKVGVCLVLKIVKLASLTMTVMAGDSVTHLVRKIVLSLKVTAIPKLTVVKEETLAESRG